MAIIFRQAPLWDKLQDKECLGNVSYITTTEMEMSQFSMNMSSHARCLAERQMLSDETFQSVNVKTKLEPSGNFWRDFTVSKTN